MAIDLSNASDFFLNFFITEDETKAMVAQFCLHLSDNYIDLSNLYVDLSDNDVDLSVKK